MRSVNASGNSDGMDTRLFRPAGRNILRTKTDRIQTPTYPGCGARALIRASFHGTLGSNYDIANMLVVMAGDNANDTGGQRVAPRQARERGCGAATAHGVKPPR